LFAGRRASTRTWQNCFVEFVVATSSKDEEHQVMHAFLREIASRALMARKSSKKTDRPLSIIYIVLSSRACLLLAFRRQASSGEV
jgi:hypothetical protein